MKAFLYIDLTCAEQFVTYQQPDVQLVKHNLTDVAILDIDAASDDMLVHYARKVLQEATQVAVCIKANEAASFRILTTLLEDLLQASGQQLILLRGENQRLQRILQARPQLHFRQLENDTDLLETLKEFYS